MKSAILRRVTFLGLVTSFCIAVLAASADEKQEPIRYEMSIKAQGTTTSQGAEQKMAVNSAIRYSWQRAGQEKTLTFQSLELTMKPGDAGETTFVMSRAGLKKTAGGKTEDTRFEDAPARVQKNLEDTFGAPICKLVVDETGRETKRTMVAGPGAKALLDQGMVVNALLFHPTFLKDKEEWQDTREINMGIGSGGIAKGKLTYARQKGGKAGQVNVKVSGTIRRDAFRPQGAPEKVMAKNAQYKITGTQTYDPQRQEWVAGQLTINHSLDLESEGMIVGSVTGTMRVTLKVLDSK
jgi:hypothetical protein